MGPQRSEFTGHVAARAFPQTGEHHHAGDAHRHREQHEHASEAIADHAAVGVAQNVCGSHVDPACVSDSMAPSTMRIFRRARFASSGSWVTISSVMPSLLRRSRI